MKEASRGGIARVAVVGRPNVGKSTLVNRLAARRAAISHETPGVTRDRVDVEAAWRGRSFVVSDTGGFTPKPRSLDASAWQQALAAVGSSALALLVVDAVTGIQQEDLDLARVLRRVATPVLVVANKADSPQLDASVAEFYALGFGDPIPVSSLHGRGTAELLDRMVELFPEESQPEVEVSERFALVGRPNVGKSSLFNSLVGHDRSIVHDAPGTTRDAVDTLLDLDSRRVRFVDTAGLRRAVKTKGIEYYGLVRALRAIADSDVAMVVTDASVGLTGEDKRIAAHVVEAGRGILVVANKWDLVPGDERADRFRDMTEQLQVFAGAPALRTSARTGQGVGRILPALFEVHRDWSRRLTTSEVNKVVQAAVEAYPSKRGRIRYATQVRAAPPTFVLFASSLPEPSYRRYLENSLRRSFGLNGVPLRFSFRTRAPRSPKSEARRS